MNTSGFDVLSIITGASVTDAFLWVMVGAFAGSIIFAASLSEYTTWIKVVLFAAAMIIGVLSSELIASIISFLFLRYLGASFLVPASLGAVISSALSVRTILFIGEKHECTYELLSKVKKNRK
ncbi:MULTISPECIES: putative holin [unclassified Leclercia]|uniref:Phage holin n=1 Tax=Leclercia barmai TaxID=2785629 RepID=A0ABS7RYM6_9ENTR|nr:MULTISPECIES: putative holin [unclassified Leclercia]MBZ0058988.1 hypothetical protein [Leclercia sp. EMC7]MCM5697027.1 phage holin family protein [Leclercia sp. LTM01]MCM5701145.1 phage holin family protein [Leclercia sp. LTM14]